MTFSSYAGVRSVFLHFESHRIFSGLTYTTLYFPCRIPSPVSRFPLYVHGKRLPYLDTWSLISAVRGLITSKMEVQLSEYPVRRRNERQREKAQTFATSCWQGDKSSTDQRANRLFLGRQGSPISHTLKCFNNRNVHILR